MSAYRRMRVTLSIDVSTLKNCGDKKTAFGRERLHVSKAAGHKFLTAKETSDDGSPVGDYEIKKKAKEKRSLHKNRRLQTVVEVLLLRRQVPVGATSTYNGNRHTTPHAATAGCSHMCEAI